MKVFISSASYAPAVCGVQEVVQRIAEGLVERGHGVTVGTIYNAHRTYEELNGVKIRQFDIHGTWMRGFRGEVKEYQKVIKNLSCDIMMNYAALSRTSDLVFPLLSKISFKKIFVPCGYSTLCNWKWKPYYWRLPSVLKKYDHIIYHSDSYQDKEFGDKHGIKNYTVIPNGASDEEFLRLRRGFRVQYGIATERMILCVATYSPGKNQEMVLRAFRQANLRDSTLVFIGPEFNDYSNRLRGLMQRDGFVRFFEKVPREMVVAAYHEADLFVFGSILECFPIVIVEAMASKTPFISTPVGSVAKLNGGVIVLTVAEMAKAIRYLANKGPEWEKLAAAGRKAWKANYRWKNIIDQYESLFARFVARKESIDCGLHGVYSTGLANF